MQIKIDTHTHTLASGHAYSTIKEMAEMAKEHGLEVLALTEHAPEMPGSCGEYYFRNLKILPRERYGIQMLFGVELNIMDAKGRVDLEDNVLKRMDLTIASIHPPCFQEERTQEMVMEAYVNAMKNPYINIIGHPDDERFPIDYELLAKTAKETHTLLEVNNSSLRSFSTRQNGRENVCKMLHFCKQYQVPITLGTDAHVDLEVGRFDLALEVLAECEFPEELVVSTSFEKLKPYTNRYKNTRL